MSVSLVGAIAKLGYKGFTAEQIALELNRGDSVSLVRDELDELLCDCRGTHTVEEHFDGSARVVYAFPRDFRSRLYKRRSWLWFQEKCIPVAFRSLQLAIGVFLLFSIALCVIILVLVSIRSGFVGGRGGRGGLVNTYHVYNAYVLYSFYRRNPFFRRRHWLTLHTTNANNNDNNTSNRNGGTTSSRESLAEEVFAFMFGPPPPNNQDDQWSHIKNEIKRSGFVVTADQIRPFVLDCEDETFMSKVVAALHGVPFASDDGQKMLYQFERLKGTQIEPPRRSARCLREDIWVFLDRPWTFPVLLGGANILALLALLPYMRAIYAHKVLQEAGHSTSPSLRGFVRMDASPLSITRQGPLLSSLLYLAYFLYPPMVVYAVLYFAIPAIRFLVCIKFLNARIRKRNEFRAALIARPLGTK